MTTPETLQGSNDTTPDAHTIHAALETAKSEYLTLKEKQSVAIADLTTAQNEYDKLARTAMVSNTKLPASGKLNDARHTYDSVHRILLAQEEQIDELTEELKNAELRERASNETDFINSRSVEASAAMTELEKVIRAAKTAEAHVKELLFGRDALKREFSTEELSKAARAARLKILERAHTISRELGYRFDTAFINDANPTLGDGWQAPR